MSPTTQGAIVLIATLMVLLSGAPVAFGLGALSIIFIVIFQGFGALQVVAETFYAGLNDFTLVSIPMFVMMGAAIGSSPAGRDLYEALDRWLYRLPGGLAISNLGACAIFAALTGSSPACCAAIGKMGIPEMRRLSGRDRHRLDLRRRHARHPDPAFDHLHPLRHCHRDFDRALVSCRRGPRADAHRVVHAVDAVCHLASRLPFSRGRLPLQLEREIPIGAEDRAVPRDYRRRDVCPVWRRRDTLGSRGRRRRAVRGARSPHLPHVEACCMVGDPARHDARVGDDPDDHRGGGAVWLHAHVALPHPNARDRDRRDARQPLGADGADQSVPAGMRLLHPAGGDHPDDQPDSAADHHSGGIRSGSASS